MTSCSISLELWAWFSLHLMLWMRSSTASFWVGRELQQLFFSVSECNWKVRGVRYFFLVDPTTTGSIVSLAGSITRSTRGEMGQSLLAFGLSMSALNHWLPNQTVPLHPPPPPTQLLVKLVMLVSHEWLYCWWRYWWVKYQICMYNPEYKSVVITSPFCHLIEEKYSYESISDLSGVI